MLIRSQDKKIITNLDNVSYLTIEGIEKKWDELYTVNGTNIPNTWFIRAEGLFIGEYSTEEKAIKVLDAIQDIYAKHLEVRIGNMTTAAYNWPKVFQMPQDDEV